MNYRMRQSFRSGSAKGSSLYCRPLLGLIAIVSTALSGQAAFALDVVHVSYSSSPPFYIPVAVALQQGFFRDQNLDVKLIATRAEVDRAALVSGDIDFTLRIGSTILSAARTLPVRTVFLSTVMPFWALVARPDVQSVADLRGKIIGSGGVAGSHYGTTKVILRRHGLDPDKEVTLKFIGPGERIAAVMSKSIDAVNLKDVSLQQLFDFSLLQQVLKETR
ncbi:MAG: ABC transporter substrate-binding protein [Candidatus Binatia bacterium]